MNILNEFSDLNRQRLLFSEAVGKCINTPRVLTKEEEKIIALEFLTGTRCLKKTREVISLTASLRGIPVRLTFLSFGLDVLTRDNETSFPLSLEVIEGLEDIEIEDFY